ncbi:MAG: hypothetical protein IPL78_21245 [Chloroflexi bacterium]|nr:hypothetical protein [Chloroflexota bacterium]
MISFTPTPAELDAIAITRPNLVHLARIIALRHPILTDRVWRAVRIVAEGKVRPPRGDYELALVLGSRQQNYSIYVEEKITCDCKDHPKAPQTVENGIHFCKHILAHYFSREEETLEKMIAATGPLVDREEEEINALFVPEGVTANV